MQTTILPTERPFVLVVGIDLMDTYSSGYALNQAARIAMRIPGSEMHVLYVIPSGRPHDVHETAIQLKRYVMGKTTELGGLARQSVGIHLREGEPGHAIAQLASDIAADVIIVGTHKESRLKDMFVGSTASRVMTTAACPVLVAGPRPAPVAPHVIVIEGPCPDCVQARSESEGRTWWCARHSEPHHLHGRHHYSYRSELPFAEHDASVVPNVP